MLFILYMVIYSKYLTVNILLTDLSEGTIPCLDGKIIFIGNISAWKSISRDLYRR